MAGGQGLAGSGLSVSLIADVEKAVRDITVTADTVINKLNEVKFAAKQAQKSIADSYKQIGQNLGRIGSDIDRTVRGTGKMRRIFTDIGKTGIGRIFDPTEETNNIQKIQNAWRRFTESRPVRQFQEYQASRRMATQEAWAKERFPHEIPRIPRGAVPGSKDYELAREAQEDFYRGIKVPGVFRQALVGAMDEVKGLNIPELMFGGLRDLGNYFGMVASWVGRVRVIFQSLGNEIKNVLTSPFRVLKKTTDWVHNILTAMFKTFQWFQYQLFMQFMNFWLLTKTLFPILETFLNYNKEIYQTWALIGDTWGKSLDTFMDKASQLSFTEYLRFFEGADVHTEEELQNMYDTTQRILSSIGEDVGSWLSAVGLEVAREFALIPQDVASAMYLIASATVAFEDVIPTLDSVAKAAVAGATSIEEATQAGISAAYAFGIELSKLDEILELQFLTIRYGILRYEDLTKVMGRVYQPAASLSDTMENLAETYATMAFATRMGLGPEMAAFGMARLFEALSRAQVVSNLRELGVNVYDTTGYFMGLYGVVEQLAGALRGLTTETQQKMLSTMGFDMRAIRVLRSLINNFTEYTNLMGLYMTEAFGAEKATNAMEAAYNRMRDSYAFLVDRLKASWEALKVEVVQHTIETLLYFVEQLNNLLRVTLGLFRGASEGVGQLGVSLQDWLKYGAVIYGVFALIATLSGVLQVIISPMGLVTAGFMYLVKEVRAGELPLRYLIEQFPLLANVIQVASKYLDVFRNLMKDRAPIAHFAKAVGLMFEELFGALSAYPTLGNIITSIKDMGRALRAVFDPYQEQEIMFDFFVETGARSADIFDVITYRYGQIFRSIGLAVKTLLQRAFRLDTEDTGEVVRQSISRIYSMIMSTFAAVFDEPPDQFTLFRFVGRTLEALGIVIETSFGGFRLAPQVMRTVADFFVSIISGALNLMLTNVDVLFAIAGYKLITTFLATFWTRLGDATKWFAAHGALGPGLAMATLKFYAVIEIIDMLLGRKVSQFLEDVFGSQLMATVVKALMGAFVAVMAIAPLRELWFGMFPAKAIKAQMVKMFATSMVGAGTFDVISAQSILISLKGFIKSLYTKILLPIFGKGGFLWQMLGGIGVAGWLGPAAIIGATSIRKDSQRRSEIYEGIVADMPQVITPFGVSLRALSQTLQNADSATKTWKSSIVSLLVGVGTLIGASFIPGGVPFIGFAAKLFGFSQLFEGLFDLTRFEALTFPQLRKAVVDQQTMLAEQMIDAIRDTRLRGVFEALSERYMDVVDKTFVTALEGEVFTHPHSAIPKVAERNVRVMMGLFEVMYQFEELQSLLTRIEVPGEGVRFMLRESGRDAIVELLGRLKKTDELYIALDSFWKQTDSLSFNLPFTAPIGRVDRIAYILTHRMDSFAYTVNEVGTVVNQSIMQMLTRVESLAGYVTAEDYDAIVNRIVAWSEAFLVGGLIPESGMLDDLDRQIQELERQVGKVNLGKVAGTALRELNALVLKDYLVELAESLDPHTLIAQLETTLARTTPGLSLLTPVDTLGTTIRDLLLDEQIEPALNEIVKAVTSLDDDMRTQGLRWARGFIGVLEELQLDIFSYQDILTIQYLMAQLTLAERGQGTPLERSVSELLLGMLRFAEGNYSLVEQVMGFLEYLDTVKPDMNIENIAAEFESYMGDAFAELFKPTIGEILGVRVANALLDIVRDTDFSFVVGDRQVFDPLRGVLYPDSATQKQFVDPMNVFIREYLGRAMPMLLPDVGDVDAIFTAISRIFKLDSVAPELLSSVTSVLRDMSARIAKEIDVSTGDVVISDVLDEYYEFIRSALGADSEAVRIFEALGSQFIELEKLFRSPGAQQALTAFHNVENVEQLLKVFTEVGLNNQEAAKELLEFWKTVITETNKITEQVIKTRDSLVRGLPELSKFYSERETRAKFEFYMNMMAVLFSPVELMSSLLMDVYDASLMPMHRWDYELPQLLTPNMMNEWFEQNIGLLVQFGLITDAEIQRIAADTSGAALGEYIDRLRAGTDSFSAYADGMFAFTEVMMEIDKLQDPFRERDIRYMTGQEIWTWGTRLYNNFAAFFSSASAVLFDPALWQGIMDSTTSLSVIIEEIGEGVAERFNDALYLPHNEFMRRLGEYGFRTEEFMKEMRIEDARASVLKAAQAMDLNIDNLDEWALSLADIVDGWIIRVPKPGAGGEFGAQAVGLEEKAEEFFEINLGVFYRWYDNLTSVVENYTKGLADEAFQLLGVSFKLPIASALVTTFTGYGKKLVEGWLRDQTAKIMVGVYNWLMGSTEEGPGAFAKFFQESDLLVDEEISDFAFAIASDVARLANQGLRVLLDLALGRLDVAIARLASYFVFDEGAVVGINWQRLMPSVLSFFGKLDETVAKETVRHYVEFFAEGSFLQTLQDALDKYETGDIIARDLERIFSEQWREVRNFTRDVAGEIFDNRFISGILQGLVSIFFWVTERMGAHEWILSAFAKTDPIQGLYSMIGAEAVPDLLSNLPIREWSEELWQIAIGGLIESGQVNINAMKKHLRTYEEFDLSDDQVNQYLRMVTNSIHELLTMRIEEYITSEDLQRLGVDSAFILEEFPTIGELVGLLRLASLDDTIFAPGVIDGFLDAFRIDPETLTKEMPNIIRDIVDFVTANKAEFEQVLEKYGDVVKLQQIAGVPFLGGIMERLVAEAVGVRPDQIDWMKVFEDLNPDETNKIMEEFNSQVETLISIASQAGAMLVSIADNMEELDWGSETMRNWIQFTGRSIQHLIEAINVMVMGQTIAGILGLGDWTTWIFLGIAALAGILAAIVDWKRIFGGVSDLLDKSLVAIQNNTSAMQSLTNILDSLNNTLYNQPGAFAYGYMMPGFATGGITGGAPAEIAGVVHGGEWVAPAWMVGHNVYGKQIAELESVRARGFRTGGYTSDSFGLDHTDRIEIIPKQDVSIVVNVTINGDMSNPDEVLDKVEDRVLRAFKRSRV